MKIKQKPDVRFPAFNDDWKEYKAGSIFYSLADKNYPELPVLSASQEKGMVFRKDIGINIQYDKNSTKTYKRVMPGQFVIHLRSFQGGFAFSDIEGITSPAYTVLDFKNKDIHDSLFWKSILTSKNFIKRLETVTYGIRDGRSISFNDFSTLNFKVPNYNEQLEISSFFKTIDDLLTYRQQELDTLKQTKQGFLKKMFPKEGESVPELRFSGFPGIWKDSKFFDNINNTIDFRGRTPKKLGLEWSKSGYLALSALNVKNGYIDPSADAHYADEELYQKWMGRSELKKGQVLFTTEAPMGNVAQVPDDKGYILSQRTIAFDVNENKITNDFLGVLLRSPQVFNELSSLSSGGTAKGVSRKSLSQLKVKIPVSLNEQIQIGNFFKQLDELIALQEQELDALKQTKRAFLQKMFV